MRSLPGPTGRLETAVVSQISGINGVQVSGGWLGACGSYATHVLARVCLLPVYPPGVGGRTLHMTLVLLEVCPPV